MMEWNEAPPKVDVPPDAYRRLLGYPPGHVIDGRAKELAEWAQAWYAEYGRPWTYAREAGSVEADGAPATSFVRIEGLQFHSSVLGRRFERAGVDAAVLAAFSAGEEIEREAQRRWRDDKPDEYVFLEALGSAVVERLAAIAGARLCEWAEERQMAVLPHYSPGYPGWGIAEQSRLLGLFRGAEKFPGKMEALESGALRPKKSLLAVFGLTRQTAGVRPLTEIEACGSCSLARCQYREVTGER